MRVKFNDNAMATVWSPVEKYVETKKVKTCKQQAFAIILLKDGNEKVFPPVSPKFHANKTESDQSGQTLKKATHSEEILVDQLDDYLHRNGTRVENPGD